MNERLQRIEARLGPEEWEGRVPQAGSPTSSLPESNSDDYLTLDAALDMGDASHPVQVGRISRRKAFRIFEPDLYSSSQAIAEEIGRIEARTADLHLHARSVANPCDPLVRGLVSVSEVELAFGLYFNPISGKSFLPCSPPVRSFVERIEPWALGTDCCRRPLVLREQSPFLFTVILLITSCEQPAHVNTESR